MIVGLGASAGGLSAFKTFFENMPATSSMAFVLVQHLAPDHQSMLADILGKVTTMPVSEAEDGQPIAANRRANAADPSTHSFLRLPKIKERIPFASRSRAPAAMALSD